MNVKEKNFSGQPTAPLPKEKKVYLTEHIFRAENTTSNLRIVEDLHVGAETATTKSWHEVLWKNED